MLRRSWWLVTVMLYSACGGGLERVAFSTDLLSYPRGGRVGLTLVNTSTSTLGINLCLSRLVEDDRVTGGPSDTDTCTLESTPLEPGARLDARKLIPATTTSGTWRYETTLILPPGAGEKAFTPAFTVAP